MNKLTKTETEEVSMPVWFMVLVGLAVIGVIGVLLVCFLIPSSP